MQTLIISFCAWNAVLQSTGYTSHMGLPPKLPHGSTQVAGGCIGRIRRWTAGRLMPTPPTEEEEEDLLMSQFYQAWHHNVSPLLAFHFLQWLSWFLWTTNLPQRAQHLNGRLSASRAVKAIRSVRQQLVDRLWPNWQKISTDRPTAASMHMCNVRTRQLVV